jgi:hypothetical protein
LCGGNFYLGAPWIGISNCGGEQRTGAVENVYFIANV